MAARLGRRRRRATTMVAVASRQGRPIVVRGSRVFDRRLRPAAAPVSDGSRSRYATLGFEEAAKLDDGIMWPTSYALTKLTAADEKRIGALVKQAVS